MVKFVLVNWKLFLGKFLYNAEQRLIKTRFKFIEKHYPYGRNWIFDVKRILKKPSVIIDAGANIGHVTLELHYRFRDADIYAFEPINDTFSLLQNNTKHIANIHPLKLALGERAEFTEILVNKENTINSLKLREAHQYITGTEQIEIVRLDRFFTEKNIDQIDILKIDVEGFEFEVLNGCGDVLKNVRCIYLEVGYEREPAKVHFSDVECFMEANAFRLCGIYETRRDIYNKQKLWYSNFLYVRKELLER